MNTNEKPSNLSLGELIGILKLRDVLSASENSSAEANVGSLNVVALTSAIVRMENFLNYRIIEDLGSRRILDMNFLKTQGYQPIDVQRQLKSWLMVLGGIYLLQLDSDSKMDKFLEFFEKAILAMIWSSTYRPPGDWRGVTVYNLPEFLDFFRDELFCRSDDEASAIITRTNLSGLREVIVLLYPDQLRSYSFDPTMHGDYCFLLKIKALRDGLEELSVDSLDGIYGVPRP